VNDVRLDFLRRLRVANIERNREYREMTGGQPLPLLFRAVELAGEIGELVNVIKKMERERLGWRGKKADENMLKEEVGGAFVVFDLLLMDLGIDLADVTTREFNNVSDRLGLTTRLENRCRFCDDTGWFYGDKELSPCQCPAGTEVDDRIKGTWPLVEAADPEEVDRLIAAINTTLDQPRPEILALKNALEHLQANRIGAAITTLRDALGKTDG
jgi:hypothetical protein